MIRQLRFWAAHALPRVHWTAYRETATGEPHLAVWRQWGRRCWSVTDVVTAEPHRPRPS